MTKRKAFALRVNEEYLKAVQQWADDELRSLNAQIEYVLREALRREGRLPKYGGPIRPCRLASRQQTTHLH